MFIKHIYFSVVYGLSCCYTETVSSLGFLTAWFPDSKVTHFHRLGDPWELESGWLSSPDSTKCPETSLPDKKHPSPEIPDIPEAADSHPSDFGSQSYHWLYGSTAGTETKVVQQSGMLGTMQTSGKIWDKHNQGLQGPSGAGKVSFPFSPRRQWGAWGARSRLMVSAQLWAAGVVQSSCTAPAHPHWPSSQVRRVRLGGKSSELNILKNADVTWACSPVENAKCQCHICSHFSIYCIWNKILTTIKQKEQLCVCIKTWFG